MLEILGRIIAFVVIMGFIILCCLVMNNYLEDMKTECDKMGGTYIDGYGYYDSCIYDYEGVN